MKRVLCILSSMNAGGAETFLMKIYRRLDKTKYQMDFCVNQKENYYAKEIESYGGKIYCIPTKSESVARFREGLTRIVKENGYQYVLRITSNAMGFMDLKIAKQAGARICAARSSNSSDGSGWKPYVAHRLGRLLYGNYVDVKIAPSDVAAAYTFGERTYKNGGVSILHNAVDLEQFVFDPEARKRIREELQVGEETTLVGHVGRFAEQKNHMFLLDIFAGLHKKAENVMLLLAGKGELEEKLRAKVRELGLEDRVIFAGVRSDVPQLLSAMDVFVFPSFYEGMPNTVIEAQAVGLPCVIADTITREANITGAVDYLSLSAPAAQWAERVLERSRERIDSHPYFYEYGYDIQSVVKNFISLVFQDS